jgi:signal transduction histidine kinase
VVKFFFLGFLLCLAACKQKTANTFVEETVPSDSSAVYLAKAKDNNLAKTERIKYNLKAFQYLSNSGKNDSLYRKSVLKVAAQFYALGDYENFNKAARLGLEKAETRKDTVNIIKANSFIAQSAMDLGKNDSAFIYYTRAERFALPKKDYESLVDIYFKKALIQSNINDFSGCELTASKSLNYLKYIDNKDIEYYAYNLIGVSSNEMKNYDRALYYHNRALKIVTDSPEKDIYYLGPSSMNNIGVVYQNMNMHIKAISFFEQALGYKNLRSESPGLYAILLDNLAYSKFKSNNLSELPNLFFKSLRIRDSLGLSSGIVVNKIHLSEYYAFKKDTMNSQKYAWEALNISKKSKISGDILGSLKQIFLIDHKNAANYYREYIKISDSIQQAERKIKDRFDRVQFETDEIKVENDKLEEQNRTLFYFFIGTLMIGVLLFVIRTQRAKNRELMLKQAQQKANEDIYNLMISQQNTIEESRTREKKRIAQELHDGVLGRLFGARLNLDSLNRQNSEEAALRRNDYLTELKNIEQDIREISHDLNREKYILINNFVAILNNLLEEQNNSFESDLYATIDESIKWDQIENTAKINLYRIIQESLQNINKYANADTIKLELKKIDDRIQLIITDDGAGFVVNSKKKGIGLQNMISRTHELSGTFDVKSKRNRGTIISMSFPIKTN